MNTPAAADCWPNNGGFITFHLLVTGGVSSNYWAEDEGSKLQSDRILMPVGQFDSCRHYRNSMDHHDPIHLILHAVITDHKADK